MHSRRAILGFAAATPALILTAHMGVAREKQTFESNGLAIGGYDPVGYFTDAKPVRGSSAHTTSYKDSVWQFTSAENLQSFLSNPAKYGAQYGGYCAWAASQGYIAPTVPEAWTVHNDRLYLNANLRIRRRWLRDVDNLIAKGDANWPGILG